MKLAIAQMVLGAVIMLILLPYLLPGLSSMMSQEGVSAIWGFAVPYPGFIIPLLGLAVLGCGLAQLLKGRVFRHRRD